MYYYKNRYYSSDQGRFISRDPIGYHDGMGLYAYVHNNPIDITDPTGTISSIGNWHKNCLKLTDKKKRCKCHCVYAVNDQLCQNNCIKCGGGKKKISKKEFCKCACVAAGNSLADCEKACCGIK